VGQLPIRKIVRGGMGGMAPDFMLYRTQDKRVCWQIYDMLNVYNVILPFGRFLECTKVMEENLPKG